MKVNTNDLYVGWTTDFTLRHDEEPLGLVEVTFADGALDVPARGLILNVIMWRIFIEHNIPITMDKYVPVTGFTQPVVGAMLTKHYKFMLDTTTIKKEPLLKSMWSSINDWFNYVTEFLQAYQSGMDIISLGRLLMDPAVKEIVDRKTVPTEDTLIAEIKLRQNFADFMAVVEDPNAVENNVMTPFLQAEVLKKNQIPQMMLAYGARSDINDRMVKHVINASAMSGLQSVEDYAVESLSPKKATFFNRSVISSTQYFARVLRLSSLTQVKTYKGDCGNRKNITITIPKGKSHNYVDKDIYIEGTHIVVSEDNHTEFAGQRVEMITAVTCRHRDGVCERCAGRGTGRPWDWLPNLHIGLLSATNVGKAISQMVLSAKHLISTNTIKMILGQQAAKFFTKHESNIIMSEQYRKRMKHLTMVIRRDDIIGHIADLERGIKIARGFTEITTIGITDGVQYDEVSMVNDKGISVYLSRRILSAIAENWDSIDTSHAETVGIPLKILTAKSHIFEFDAINDDMVAFTKSVKSIVKGDMPSFTSVSAALSELSTTIYSKTSINIFFIEVLVKSLLVDSSKHCKRVNIDPDNSSFNKMDDNITASSCAAKLGHERIDKGGYLRLASTYTVDKNDSCLDSIFGFSEED